VLVNLLVKTGAEVCVITEAEVPSKTSPSFAVDGYTPFHPPPSSTGKYRVLLLVKSSLATSANARLRTDLMSSAQTIWVELDVDKDDCSKRKDKDTTIIGGVYREWGGLAEESRAAINELAAQMKVATTDSHHVTVLGDFNLDCLRTLKDDPQYQHHALVAILDAALEEAGLKYTKTGVTFRSYGQHPKPDGTREHRYSCLDHVYSTSNMEIGVSVLEDSSSDHRPVLAKAVLNICQKPRSGTIRHQKFKGLAAAEVDEALDNGTDWSLVHDIMDVNAVHQFITRGITRAMDVFAPLKDISVKDGHDVYLSEETLSMMRVRDTAKGNAYRKAKNRVTALVRRDKVLANTRRPAESENCPRVL
jgi:hypothetical protein